MKLLTIGLVYRCTRSKSDSLIIEFTCIIYDVGGIILFDNKIEIDQGTKFSLDLG